MSSWPKRSQRGVKFIDLKRHQEAPFPDVEVEFKTVVPRTVLDTVLSGIEDSHVMLETLRDVPREQNSMVREQPRSHAHP